MRLSGLTGLRAVAAYSVLIAHVVDANYRADPFLHGLASRLAYLGMSLFFVLSGFVIYFNYHDAIRRPHGIRNFAVARAARLYPLYLVAIVIYAAMGGFTSVSPSSILTHALLVQSWVNTQEAFLPATWSISTEWFFYLVFALMALTGVLARWSRRPVRAGITLAATAVLLLSALFINQQTVMDSLAAAFGPIITQPRISADLWGWFSYYSPYVRVFEFLMGMIAAMIYQRGTPRVSHFAGVVALAWVGVVLAFGHNLAPGFTVSFLHTFVYAPALVVVMLYTSQEGNVLKWAMSLPVLVFLGEISYSVYLLQGLGRTAALPFVSGVVTDLGLSVAFTTAIAAASYFIIEMPSRRFIRRMLSFAPKQTATAAGAPAATSEGLS